MPVPELEFDWADPRRVGADGVAAAASPDPRFPPVSGRRIAELAMQAQSNRAPSKTGGRQAKTPHTYVVGMEGSNLVKIGYAADPKKRLQSLQVGQPAALNLLWYTPGDFEAALHRTFEAYRVRGEWFDLSTLGNAVEVIQWAVTEFGKP